MKNKTFLDSIICAIRGIKIAFMTEKNFLIYFCIASIFGVIKYLLNASLTHWVIYLIAAFGVFSAEMLNTMVEHTLNIISKDIRNDIGTAKDIGSGAVLIWGILFFGNEGAVIAKWLMQLFQCI